MYRLNGEERPSFVLGLDWDGTLTDYAPAFAKVAALCTHVVIITLNREITLEMAASELSLSSDRIRVCVCPDDRFDDYDHWKSEQCILHHVSVMFDDDPCVIDRCLSIGVAAIGVR